MTNRLVNYDKCVYILFKTQLITLSEVLQGRGYQSPFFDIFQFGDGSIFTRMQNYLVPPFNHVKIAFKERNSSQFEAYSIDLHRGFGCFLSDFLDHPGYSLLKIVVDDNQLALLLSLMQRFIDKKESLTFSLYKSSAIEGKMRNALCMGPVDYPCINRTLKWMCSELVTYCLQSVGILDRDCLHPSYTTPTHLFFELILLENCKISQSFNPFYLSTKIYPAIKLDDTNAFLVYKKIMLAETPSDVFERGVRFMSGSLCKKGRSHREYMPMLSVLRGNFDIGKINSYNDYYLLDISSKEVEKKITELQSRVETPKRSLQTYAEKNQAWAASKSYGVVHPLGVNKPVAVYSN